MILQRRIDGSFLVRMEKERERERERNTDFSMFIIMHALFMLSTCLLCMWLFKLYLHYNVRASFGMRAPGGHLSSRVARWARGESASHHVQSIEYIIVYPNVSSIIAT